MDAAKAAAQDDRPLPAPDLGPRPLAILTRPWFWLLAIGGLWLVPFIKGVGSEYPDPVPGWDGAPIDFTLPDDGGREVSLSQLAGRLVVVTELPFANAAETQRTFDDIRRLRKRLRGLGDTVLYLALCHGGSAEDVSALVEERTARKPVNLFLMDEDRATLDWLRREAGSVSARWFLLDRHARIRGPYGSSEDEVNRLVTDTGQLANWLGADPPPGRNVAH